MQSVIYIFNNIFNLRFNRNNYKTLVCKNVIKICILIFILTPQLQLNAQEIPDAQLIQMGHKFYNDKKYDKAAPIFKEYYDKTKSFAYFELYFNCLTALKDYKNAEREIKNKLRTQKNPRFLVMWGYLYKQQGDYSKSEEKYNLAIDRLSPIKHEITNLGNAFISRGEYDFAIRTYEKGKTLIPNDPFHIELGFAYYFVRNYTKMLDEYLLLLNKTPESLSVVQSRLTSAFYYDINSALKNEVKLKVLEYIHKYPNNTSYNKLIIWLFTYEKEFGKALKQSIALDKRTNNESPNIFNLAQQAINNKAYSDANTAYDYLIAKGEKSQFHKLSILSKVQLLYVKFLDEYPFHSISILSLEEKFKSTLHKYGINNSTLQIIPDYGEFLAFHAKKPGEAILLLENSINTPGISGNLKLKLKYALARCYVCSNDLWGATLQCAQIIDMDRNNPLADDAKLLKAKVGYFMGNFAWAVAQMDILKAATSKLIANDAMELSLLIKNYSPADSTDIALKMFAHADMQQFCNNIEDAIATLDSIVSTDSYNPILEEVIYKKALLFISLKQYDNAALALENIIENYQWGSRIDDALFELAGIYSNELDNNERAEDLYKDILLNHKGSIYLEKARKEFRRLRGDLEN